jgi:hypothetical protein
MSIGSSTSSELNDSDHCEGEAVTHTLQDPIADNPEAPVDVPFDISYIPLHQQADDPVNQLDVCTAIQHETCPQHSYMDTFNNLDQGKATVNLSILKTLYSSKNS